MTRQRSGVPPQQGHDRYLTATVLPLNRQCDGPLAEKGAYLKAIGQSRGGRTKQAPRAERWTGAAVDLAADASNINDISVAKALLQKVGPVRRLIADRGYDANHLRRFLAEQQAEAVIPSTTSRREPLPYDTVAYRD